MVQKNDLITLNIESMTHDGSGVGRADGFAVFVPETAVGDVAAVRIVKVNKSYAYGKAEALIKPSPDRQEAPCPVFPKCGGCSLMHMSYEAELRLKQERVRRALEKIGGFPGFPVEETLPSPQVYGYRNKAQFPVGGSGQELSIGFYSPRSHRIIDTEQCMIQGEQANQVLRIFRRFLKEYRVSVYDGENGLVRHLYVRSAADGGYMAVVVVNGERLPKSDKLIDLLKRETDGFRTLVLNCNKKKGNAVLGEKCVTLFGDGFLEDVLCGVTFRLSPLSFYQVNHAQAERLYGLILELAGLSGQETVIDLYCGAGTIGLTLAHRAKEVIGVEVVSAAVEDARYNAAQNGIQNARFLCDDAEHAAARLAADGILPDVVVVDPPRKGCGPETLRAILKMAPKRVVYMSCDCETMARDLKELCAEDYRLERCIPADMFPRTPHVETVVLITRADK